MSLQITLPQGGTLELPPTARPDLRSVLLLAPPKTGSTLLGWLVRKLCAVSGIPVVTLHDDLFRFGIMEFGEKVEGLGLERLMKPTGYVYGPFRQYPLGIPFNAADFTNILLVRDPRDALVSDYYSMAFSHPAPGGEARDNFIRWQQHLQHRRIDDVVRERSRFYLGRYLEFIENVDLATAHVYRYEDVIYSKADWTRELARVIGCPVTDQDADRIAAEHDIVPDAERVSDHIRQVHPGNYKAKLEPSTIAAVDSVFESVMARFGYPKG